VACQPHLRRASAWRARASRRRSTSAGWKRRLLRPVVPATGNMPAFASLRTCAGVSPSLWATSATSSNRTGTDDRALALTWRGDLAGALEAARIARSLTEVTGDRRLEMVVRGTVAWIQVDLAQDEAARAEAQAVVAGADEFGGRALRGFARSMLAYFHTQREEWDLAGDVFAQCATILEGTDQRLIPLYSGAFAASVAWRQGRTEEATNTIETTLELARAANSPYLEAVACRVRGQMLSEQELWPEAGRMLDAAVSVLEQLGSRLELGRALYARGNMQGRQGNMTAARADVERAHAIFVEVGARRDVKRAARYVQSLRDY